MVKEYAIILRTGQPYLKKVERHGKRTHKEYGFREKYQTIAGEFAPEEWRKRIREEIEAEGKLELLDRVREYCRTHCVWLKKAEELEEYAMNCLAKEAFERWEDFEEDSQDIIWM